MMLSMLNMCYQEIEKNKAADADEDEEDNLDAAITRIKSEDNHDNNMYEYLRTSVLLLPKQRQEHQPSWSH
jgi:hypothetical protein